MTRGILMTESKGSEDSFGADWDEDDEDAQKDKYLTFIVGDEVFGFEIEFITEIVGIQKITEVPDMKNYIKGVINLRGLVIPVVDVRLRFGLEPREYDDRTCVIVVQLNDMSVGLIVDIVREVTNISEDKISRPPKVYGGTGSQYISGMGKLDDMVVILLSVTALLYENGSDTLSGLPA